MVTNNEANKQDLSSLSGKNGHAGGDAIAPHIRQLTLLTLSRDALGYIVDRSPLTGQREDEITTGSGKVGLN